MGRCKTLSACMSEITSPDQSDFTDMHEPKLWHFIEQNQEDFKHHVETNQRRGAYNSIRDQLINRLALSCSESLDRI